MKRRSFVKAAALTGAVAGIAPALAAPLSTAESLKKQDQEFYEIRIYQLKNEAQQKLVEDYWSGAAIPAYNRYGSKQIGVFTELKPEGFTRLFVLIPYNTIEDFIGMPARLAADAAYQQKAAPYLSAPITEPAYERIESWLLRAFVNAPKLVVPPHKPRMFELRQYESPTETAGKTKIQMFNKEDEMGIFRRLGFNPVFFSEMLVGTHRPNLTYMVTFDDMAQHDQLWKNFGNDPTWKRVSSLPEYPDKIVSHITSTFLVPTIYSQI